MNKRFASFLFAGKIATVPLLANTSLGSIQNTISKESLSINKQEASGMQSLTIVQPIGNHGRNIIFLPVSYDQNQAAKIMHLVITGLYDQDEVLIVLSPEKDTVDLLEKNPTLSEHVNLVILNRFSVIDSHFITKTISIAKESSVMISLPIDISSIPDRTYNWQKLNLHVLVAPHSRWDTSLIRYSETFELKSLNKSMLVSLYGDVTEDCTSYTCN